MTLAAWPTYDSYKDSGVEWIGDVPETWGVKALRRFISVQSGDMLSKEAETAEGYPIYGGNGIRGFTSKFNTTAPMILIGRVGALCGNVHVVRTNVWASEHAYRAFPRSAFDLEFLAYTITSLNLNRFAIRTAQPLLNSDIVHSQNVPAPPLPEQRAIAAFLDEKCAKVDEAVRIKEEQIALLRERRQILIQQAVTRGLNPTAPMKHCGIDWIGQIPAHWDVENPKWLFNHRKERARKGEPQLAATQKYGVIPQSDFMDLEGRRITQVFLDFDILKHVEAGDFVMSMRSFQGGLEYSEYTGCVSSAYVALEPSPRIFAPFFKYLFKSARYIEALQATSNLVRDGQALRFDNFTMVILPVVPLEEQRAIAEYLDRELAKSDQGIAVKEEQIAALKEYKTSLINAAVTGKIKVA